MKIRYNLEAERQILGYLLNENEQTPFIFQSLKADHFYEKRHRDMFQAAKRLFDSEGGVNAAVLSDTFDAVFIAGLISNSCMSHQVEAICKNIKKNAMHRSLISTLNTYRHEAETTDEPDEVINKLSENLTGLTLEQKTGYIMSDDLMNKVMANIEGRMNGSIKTGIPTGFIDLDEKTQGWQKQHLVFLGAVPKMGKTSLALEFATNVAYKGYSSLYFTLEMSLEEMGDRQLSSSGEVHGTRIRTGKISREEQERALKTASEIGEYKMGWVDRGGISVTEIKAICRQYQTKHGLDFVVIDQLDKIDRTVYPGENDANAMKRITTQLKIMAKELDCTVLCLCQLLDKVVSARQIPRPQHGDEKGSSAPSEDADIVMFLWRPEFYFEGQYPGMAELIIARQRVGPAGVVWFTWRPDYTKFASMPKDCWPGKITASRKEY